MAFDAFIRFDRIEGESSDSKHSGWIEMTSCDMEIHQTLVPSPCRQAVIFPAKPSHSITAKSSGSTPSKTAGAAPPPAMWPPAGTCNATAKCNR